MDIQKMSSLGKFGGTFILNTVSANELKLCSLSPTRWSMELAAPRIENSLEYIKSKFNLIKSRCKQKQNLGFGLMTKFTTIPVLSAVAVRKIGPKHRSFFIKLLSSIIINLLNC